MSTPDVRRPGSMGDLVLQMFSLPVTTFSAGMEWMMRLVRGLPAVTDSSLKAAADVAAATLRTAGDRGEATRTISRAIQEGTRMSDRDLSGDDLKVVRYRILFVKRDHEHMFTRGDDMDLVAYSTTPEAWGGLKVAEFLKDVAEGKVERPAKWKECAYPEADSPPTKWKLPPGDERYLKVYYEVVDRIPREAADHDRDQIRVLRDISRKIG